MHSVIDN